MSGFFLYVSVFIAREQGQTENETVTNQKLKRKKTKDNIARYYSSSLKLALSLVLIYLLNSSDIVGKQIYLTVQTLDITVPMNHSSIKRNVNQGMNLCYFRQTILNCIFRHFLISSPPQATKNVKHNKVL